MFSEQTHEFTSFPDTADDDTNKVNLKINFRSESFKLLYLLSL